MTISFFILNLFNALALVYAESRLLEKKINFKSPKTYIVLLILSMHTFLAYFLTHSVLRILVNFQVYNFCYIYLFYSEDSDFQEITFCGILSFIFLTISEIIVALLLNVFFKAFINLDTTNAYNNNLIGYIIIIFFAIIISIKPINRFLIKVVKLFKNISSNKVLFFTFYIFAILITTLYLIYFDLSQQLKFVLLILTFIEYIFLVSFLITSYKNKEKVQKDLELMIDVTSKYEEVINASRTKNHEDKNQLIVVRDLILTNQEKAVKYIDNLIKSKYDDDDELIIKVVNIPTGGLKGLIYYKLLTMKSKGINCHFHNLRIID